MMPSPERFNSLPSHSLRICSVSSRMSTPSSLRRSKAYSRTSSLHLPLCKPSKYHLARAIEAVLKHDCLRSSPTFGCAGIIVSKSLHNVMRVSQLTPRSDVDRGGKAKVSLLHLCVRG